VAYIRLHVQQADGQLPMVCMRCGEPATLVKTKKMAWFPRWVFLLFLVHLLVLVVVALILTKRARLQAPLCEQHRWHWLVRQVFVGLSLLGLAVYVAGLVAFFMNAAPPQADQLAPFVILGGMSLFAVWLIAIIVLQSTAIRAAEITKTHILLAGVSEAFVQAVEEAEIERRVRLRQWDYEDDEPAPRRPYSPRAIGEDFTPRTDLPPDAFKE
jgi:hypothetical protein